MITPEQRAALRAAITEVRASWSGIRKGLMMRRLGAQHESISALLDALDAAEADAKRLREAIKDALAPLGTGNCKINACDGCRIERKEAIAVLRAALEETR